MRYPKKSEIESWIPRATEIFQFFMPAIDVPYPPVYIATDQDYSSLRSRIVRETGCLHDEISEDTIMEYIHGANGYAILIRQELVSDANDEHFYKMYWHELGHFYAINTEDPSLHHYSDPGIVDDSKIVKLTASGPVLGMSDERLKQEGYWFWQEFIAEALANYVSYMARSTNQNYHPELFDWHPENWAGIVERLLDLLDITFWYHNSTIDEYGLAHYLALLLMDDFVKLYVQAAKDGKLKVYDSDDRVIYSPEPIDATCIDEIEEPFQQPLRKMLILLEAHLKIPEYWKASPELLLELGRCIGDMMVEKIKLKAKGYRHEI